jgi:hypothetical protein
MELVCEAKFEHRERCAAMRWCGIIRVVACCVAAVVVWFRCETRTGGWVVVGEAVFVGGARRALMEALMRLMSGR